MKTLGRLYNSQGIALITSRYNPETQNAARFRGEAMTEVLHDLSRMLGTRVTARFSRNAGCSSCPCSPGFLLLAAVETPVVQALALGKFRHANWGYPRRTSQGVEVWVDVNTDTVEQMAGFRETLENPQQHWTYGVESRAWKQREQEREEQEREEQERVATVVLS